MGKPPLTSKGLVIGFGNVLRNDDGLGPKTVGFLDEIGFDGHDVRTLTLPQIDITLANTLASVDFAIFIDARIDDSNEPVIVEHLEPNKLHAQMGHTSHSLSIPSLIGFTREIYEHSPDCYMVVPKGYDFSIGETLSPQADANMQLASKKIINLIGEISQASAQNRPNKQLKK